MSHNFNRTKLIPKKIQHIKTELVYKLSLKIPISKIKIFPLFPSIYEEIFLNISEKPLIKIDYMGHWISNK